MCSYWGVWEWGFCKRILVMKGESAASKALGHSSCGRCPHPDIVISLCIVITISLLLTLSTQWKREYRWSRERHTELGSLEAMTWEDLRETRASSTPPTTSTGISSRDFTKASAFWGESTVSYDNLAISCNASSHPSTHNAFCFHSEPETYHISGFPEFSS